MRDYKPEMTSRGADRKAKLLAVAYDIASTNGYFHLNAQRIGREASCSRGLIPYYFGSYEGLKKEVVELARLDTRPEVYAKVVTQAEMMGEV